MHDADRPTAYALDAQQPAAGRANSRLPPTITGGLEALENIANELVASAQALHRHADMISGSAVSGESAAGMGTVKELRPQLPAVPRMEAIFRRLLEARDVIAHADARLGKSI